MTPYGSAHCNAVRFVAGLALDLISSKFQIGGPARIEVVDGAAQTSLVRLVAALGIATALVVALTLRA
jgi:hypothetical protein